ncbi:hypothetical protein QJS10_CPB19g00135 [Acorus calamus]|uniref:Polygalacturonase n=1 Tax=Acorus calamus TaxID=4465 RepID=A0AAV9CKQ4_ACOCL|nr:hypothetical protein QJS10_CPB19g00135 [Acorus calamus]
MGQVGLDRGVARRRWTTVHRRRRGCRTTGDGNGGWIRRDLVHATEMTGRVFNVVDFGAVGDGKTGSTKAIMSAWTEACNSTEGRPRLLIPQGTFFVGPVTFKGPCKGPMVVQLQGVLKASPNLADYDSDNWVVFQYIDGLVITGGGTFDGQGASAWPHNQCPKSQKCKLLPTVSVFYSNI